MTIVLPYENIQKLHLTKTAVSGQRYRDLQGNVYEGTPHRRIKLLLKASEVTFEATTNVDADDAQEAIEESFYTLVNTAVTPGTYGDTTNVAQFTVDQKGRLTYAADIAITFPVNFITSVLDTATIDLTVAAGVLSADIIMSGITHNVLSATHSDSNAGAVVRGDLMVGNATPKWDKLAVGAAGTVLIGGTDPSYSSSPTISVSVTTPKIIGGTAMGSTLTLQSTSIGAGSTTDAIIFNVGDGGATEGMRITSGGNIGIGIASPSAKLHVVGSGTADSTYALRVDGTSGNNFLTVRNDGFVGFNTTAPVLYDFSEGGEFVYKSATGSRLHAEFVDSVTGKGVIINSYNEPYESTSWTTIAGAYAYRNLQMFLNDIGQVAFGQQILSNTYPKIKVGTQLNFNTATIEEVAISSGSQAADTGIINSYYIRSNGVSETLYKQAEFNILKSDGTAAGNNVPTYFQWKNYNGASFVERMRLDENGNLGIGIAAPTVALYIDRAANDSLTSVILRNTTAGTAAQSLFHIINDNSKNAILKLYSSAFTTSGINIADSASLQANTNLTIGTYSAHYTSFWTNTAERMRIDSAGLVGIGTATPTNKLHVVDGGATTNLLLAMDCYSADDAYRSFFAFRKSGSNTIGTLTATADGEALGELAFYGVRSSTPAFTYAGGIKVEQDGAVGASQVPSRIVFKTGTSTGAVTDRVRILSSGELIIGATALVSTELFSVQKDQNGLTQIRLNNATSGTAGRANVYITSGTTGLALNANSAGYTTSGLLVANTACVFSNMTGGLNVGTSVAQQLSFWTNNTQRVTILSTGQIGIGTTTPTKTLDIAAYGTDSQATGRWSTYNDQATFGNVFNFFKSHTDTNGAMVQTIDTEVLGSINFEGVNSSNTLAAGGKIRVVQDGSATSTGIPAKIFFESTGGTSATAHQVCLTMKPDRSIEFGEGAAGYDQVIKFIGETHTGILTWMEDEDCFKFDDNVGIGVNATAALQLKAGTATAGTAPVKFTAGTNLTTPEAGALEFDGDRLYHTNSTAIREAISGVIFTQTGDQTIGNTTTETTLINGGVGTLTLPANFLIVGKAIRVRIRGIISNTGTPNFTVKAKLGSTVIATSGLVTMSKNITDKYFDCEVLLTCRTTGASGTVIGTGKFEHDATGNQAETYGIITTSAVTVATTASQAINITFEWGTADVANTLTTQVGVVEIIN